MTANFAEWVQLDMALRGAATSLLLFHVIHILRSALPSARRWALAAFVSSILSYMLCSHPSSPLFSLWLKIPAFSLCLMSAPLLWLTVQIVFDDRYRWSTLKATLLLGTLALGWAAFTDTGGWTIALLHKTVQIAFAVATLYSVFKNWHSDLVSTRRTLRSWVAGGLGGYVLVVVCVELFYLGGQAPQELRLVHLAGITAASGLVALVIAKHPLEQWFAAMPVAIDQAPLTVEIALTSPPPGLDRKAAISARLTIAMADKRAYAQEGLTLAQLAQQVDTTPVQLREVINQTLGYRNFNDFLHHYRIDEAAQRLLVQDLPILSIALDVGYGSIGPFNRAFKQIKGVTPSEFRAIKPIN